MKYLKLYEELEELEEVWEEEPDSEIDLTGVNLGKRGPKFNLLDKVVVTSNLFYDHMDNPLENKVGYIIDYDGTYLIYFIDKISGHDGNKGIHNIPNDQGWWLAGDYIKKY